MRSRRTHRVVLAAAAILALAVSSVAIASGGVVGTYTTTVKNPAQVKGKWMLALAKGGSFTVALNGEIVARGRYSATPRRITFGPERGSACRGSGTYGWRKSGKTMTFTRKREAVSCQGRAAVLAHPFRQVR
jgi:hypothetical protein